MHGWVTGYGGGHKKNCTPEGVQWKNESVENDNTSI